MTNKLNDLFIHTYKLYQLVNLKTKSSNWVKFLKNIFNWRKYKEIEREREQQKREEEEKKHWNISHNEFSHIVFIIIEYYKYKWYTDTVYYKPHLPHTHT